MSSSQENPFGVRLSSKSPLQDRSNPRTVAGRAKSLSLCSHRKARDLISYDLAQRWQVLPLGLVTALDGLCLTIAVSPEAREDLANGLRFSTGHQVKLVEVDAEVLREAIFISYHRDSKELEQHIAKLSQHATPNKIDSMLDVRSASSDSGKFLTSLIDYSIAQEASDIHIAPRHDGCYVRLRVNGSLLDHEKSVATLAQHEQLISRVKVLSSLDTTQRRLPQDGSFHVSVGERRLHLRVSTMPTVHGEKAVLRIMGKGAVLELEDLGLPPTAHAMLVRNLARQEGAILLAGSTGSGKTTTLYAAIRHLQRQGVQISSVEDPVEVFVEGVSQTSVDVKAGLNYAESLRAILRQDPDIIMLGEIRDHNSAQLAIQASLTGHLLLSTVHARSALEIVARLKNLGVDALSAAQSMNLLVCQRLVRKLCSHCKVVDFLESREFGSEIFRPVGCAQCDYSGFSGLVLVAEMIEMDEQVRCLLAQDRHWQDALSELNPNYVSMKAQICELIRAGDVYSKDGCL